MSTAKEVTMSPQLQLFPSAQPAWVDRVWQGVGVEKRREILATLAEMVRSTWAVKDGASKEGSARESR